MLWVLNDLGYEKIMPQSQNITMEEQQQRIKTNKKHSFQDIYEKSSNNMASV